MKKKTTKGPKGPAVVETYETEMEFNCPVRGKVKQKVKVRRYQAVEAVPTVPEILPSNSLAEKLDLQYSGLLMDDDSLEESGES